MHIRKPAVKSQQGKRVIFLTAFEVRDFMEKGFYRVDRLDVPESTGMQRLLSAPRARSFGNDLIGADKKDDAFLPTSVFLATGGSISYDEGKGEIFFESSPHASILPFDVVDGQHRIEGLVEAARKNERLRNLPISTVIAHKMKEPERMLQFITVNAKQQPVDQGVAQHIIARFTRMHDVENLPYIPQWLKSRIESGDENRALNIVKFLNSEPSSPWCGRVRLADDGSKDPRLSIRQASFVKSIQRHILAKNHPLNQVVADDEKRRRILNNFWIAVERVFVGPETGSGDAVSVVYKETGLDFFHSILSAVINQLAKTKNYTVEAMVECIQSAQNFPTPSDIKIMSPEFWVRGGEAGKTNRGGMRKLAMSFQNALAEANDGELLL